MSILELKVSNHIINLCPKKKHPNIDAFNLIRQLKVQSNEALKISLKTNLNTTMLNRTL